MGRLEWRSASILQYLRRAPGSHLVDRVLQALLHAEGASLDRIYYCPHNWDEGCDCRKPKPGLLYQAQHDLSIDLTRCVLFGDDERDVMAGNAARVPSIMVSEQYPLLQAVREYLR